MGAFSRSFSLLGESLAVLTDNPKLILLPLVAMILELVLVGVGVGMLWMFSQNEDSRTVPVIVWIASYFLGWFVMIFIQAVLVAAVKEYISGGSPTLGESFKQARGRLAQIVSWTIIAAVVGLILEVLSHAVRRSDNLAIRLAGEIIRAIIGAAWSLMTFFVIPIIVYEGVGGFEAVGKSFSMIKRRWGEAVIGSTSASLIVVVLAILIILIFGIPGGVLIDGGTSAARVLGMTLIGIGVGLGVLLFAAGSALQSIYTTALYEYCKGESPRQIYSEGTLRTAFAVKG
ncbi:MAG: DUF6159 family protein [Chloroflexi bacterium]|nr:DUF6159 family protein [Chloroflexota bacterium]